MGFFPWSHNGSREDNRRQNFDSQQSSPEDEQNPFVVFQRLADAHMSSFFSNFTADPWWRTFERSYERATNPERIHSESRGRDDPVNPDKETQKPRCPALRYDDEVKQISESRNPPGVMDNLSDMIATIHALTMAADAHFSHWDKQIDSSKTRSRHSNSDEIDADYRPEQLQKDGKLSQHLNWQRAFDELEPAAQRGQEVARQRDTFQRNFERARDAIAAGDLEQERHSFHDLFNMVSRAQSALESTAPGSQQRDDDQPQNELELYEHFLGRDDRSAARDQDENSSLSRTPVTRSRFGTTFSGSSHLQEPPVRDVDSPANVYVKKIMNDDGSMTVTKKTFRRSNGGWSELHEVEETTTMPQRPTPARNPTNAQLSLQKMIEDKEADFRATQRPKNVSESRKPKARNINSKAEEPRSKGGWFWSS